MSVITDLDKFLSLRPRSIYEIKNHLRKKGVGSKEIDNTISKLLKLRLVDDEDFASWWITQRKTFHPKSSRIIRLELLQKGISKDIIDRLTPDLDETTGASEVLRKKWPSLVKYDQKTRREKAIRYLSSRGYDWDTIKDAIDRAAKGDIK